MVISGDICEVATRRQLHKLFIMESVSVSIVHNIYLRKEEF